MSIEQSVRLHPEFPTKRQSDGVARGKATESKDALVQHSDHALMLATVALPETKAEANIKVVTWNVLEDASAAGFDHQEEALNAAEARWKRIANALEKTLQQNDYPDFLALQEITIPKEDQPGLLPIIQEKLRSHGYERAPKGDKSDCLLFYNSKKYTCDRPVQQQEQSGVFRGTAAYFTNNSTHQTFKVGSAHFEYTQVPQQTEAAVKAFLKDEKAGVVVLAGDFNNTVAPLDIYPANITTSVAKPDESDGDQRGFAVDGCFFSHRTKEGTFVYEQASTQQIKPTSGKPYTPTELRPLPPNLSATQEIEVAWSRPAVCVGGDTQTQRLANGKTIGQYERELQQNIDPGIVVRMSTDLRNKRLLAVIFPPSQKHVYNALKGNFLSAQVEPASSTLNYTSQRHTYVCVEFEKFSTLEARLKTYYSKRSPNYSRGLKIFGVAAGAVGSEVVGGNALAAAVDPSKALFSVGSHPWQQITVAACGIGLPLLLILVALFWSRRNPQEAYQSVTDRSPTLGGDK